MRILMIQQNYHSVSAEIAGNWPAGRVACIGGALKDAGYASVRFVDAMVDETTLSKEFYDLERLKYNGLPTEVDLRLDESKILSRDEIAALKAKRPHLSGDIDFTGINGRGPAVVSACGVPNDLRVEEQKAVVAETN